MEPLLFLAHRIPYPPNKGDKIRSYHILRNLAARYDVHLGAFVDDPADWEHKPTVEAMCASCRLVPLSPTAGKVRGALGMLTGSSLSVPYFRDRAMRGWVRDTIRQHDIRRVLVYSSPMAAYVKDHVRMPEVRSVLDYVDVDSDKWRQYAAKKPWPVSWLYAHESRALLRFDRDMAERFDHGTFVSRAEAALFHTLAPESTDRITWVENGVDTEYFSPAREYEDPFDGHRETLVFTGAMDYWANVDAVRWLAEEVMPALRRRVAGARFCIVGTRPTADVLKLRDRPGVTVTGAVPDVRPYLARAAVAVAPLRIARGIQNKVLEAMAMDRSVIASQQAMDGLETGDEQAPFVVNTPDEWVNALAAALGAPDLGGPSGLRNTVLGRYAWAGKVDRFRALLENGSRDSEGAR